MLWMKYGSRFFILLVHKFFEKISTRLLTVLIICAIVHTEQRKRERNQKDAKSPGDFQNLPDNRFQIF